MRRLEPGGAVIGPDTAAPRGPPAHLLRDAGFPERMRVDVELHPGTVRRAVDLPAEATGLDLVRALGLAPDAHLLVREGTPIPEDEALRDGERIRVVAVVSGG